MTELKDYIDGVRKQRPLLDDLVTKFGSRSMWDVSSHLFNQGETNAHLYRKEFMMTFRNAYPEVPDEVYDYYDESLAKNPFVSTADHHGLIDHPAFLSSNILLTLLSRKITPPIFSFSAIPLNNGSYPRGLLYSTKKGIKRFSFFGSSQKHQVVYAVEPIEFSNTSIQAMLDHNRDHFKPNEIRNIEKLLSNFIHQTEVNKCSTYSEQVQLWNTLFWKQFFPDHSLYFNPIDIFTKQFFKDLLVRDKTLPIYKVLFELSSNTQNELLNGIYGGWSLDKLKIFQQGGGTWFFWGIDEYKRMIPLIRDGNKLIAQSSKFTPILWEAQALYDGLEQKKLVSAMILNYFVVGGHFGIYCSGGNDQVYYYGKIMKGYTEALQAVGELGEAGRVGQINAQGVHQLLWFLFGKTNDSVVPLSSLNLLEIKGKLKNVKQILKDTDFKTGFNIAASMLFPYIVSPAVKKKMKYSLEDVCKQLVEIIPNKFIFEEWLS